MPPREMPYSEVRSEIGEMIVVFASFDRAIQCKPSETVYLRATRVACKLANRGVYPNGPGQDAEYVRRAKRYIEHLSAAKRTQAYQLCAPPCTLH